MLIKLPANDSFGQTHLLVGWLSHRATGSLKAPGRVIELLEAWQFTSWCLELGILRLLEYRGNYASRLQLGGWSGLTAPVPWNLWPVTLDRSSHAQEHAPGLPLSDPLRPRRIARR